jgi:hypothetical protein
MSLQDAVDVLCDLANARPVENRSRLIAGALALSTATYSCDDRDLADAAIGLEILATGGKLDLDETGRCRAAFLATVVGGLISSRSKSGNELDAYRV